jgi:hypothetical protein
VSSYEKCPRLRLCLQQGAVLAVNARTLLGSFLIKASEGVPGEKAGPMTFRSTNAFLMKCIKADTAIDLARLVKSTK